jgi:hypothetical protein
MSISQGGIMQYKNQDGYINKTIITRHNINYRPIYDTECMGENDKAPMFIVDDRSKSASPDKHVGLFVNRRKLSKPNLRKSTLSNQNIILFEGGGFRGTPKSICTHRVSYVFKGVPKCVIPAN